MAKKGRGLLSFKVWKSRREMKRSDQNLQQKKLELALKNELMHRLEVQFLSSDIDGVEIEVAEGALAMFILVLKDASVTSLYDYEQVTESLFVFRPKQLI